MNTADRRLRVHRFVMPHVELAMYGFREREQSELDEMAASLQSWIESKMGECPREIPVVSVCYGAYSSAIEVDGMVLWCSESHDDITTESLIQLFRDQCEKMAAFAA